MRSGDICQVRGTGFEVRGKGLTPIVADWTDKGDGATSDWCEMAGSLFVTNYVT